LGQKKLNGVSRPARTSRWFSPGKRIKALRADAALYQADIINFCYEKDMKFAIGADLNPVGHNLLLSGVSTSRKRQQDMVFAISATTA